MAGSSSGSDYYVLAAVGLAVIFGVAVLDALGNRGLRAILATHGGISGLAVSAGQMCGKYPTVGLCPEHVALYGVGSRDSANPGTLLAQKLFRAGQQNPYAANTFASPDYQYSAAAL